MSGRGATKRLTGPSTGPAHVFHYGNYAYCDDYLALGLIKGEGAFSPAERLAMERITAASSHFQKQKAGEITKRISTGPASSSVISSSRLNEAGEQQKQTKRLWCRCKVQ